VLFHLESVQEDVIVFVYLHGLPESGLILLEPDMLGAELG
jgi:hypothetical protein